MENVLAVEEEFQPLREEITARTAGRDWSGKNEHKANIIQYRYGPGDIGREKDGDKACDEATASVKTLLHIRRKS